MQRFSPEFLTTVSLGNAKKYAVYFDITAKSFMVNDDHSKITLFSCLNKKKLLLQHSADE